MEEAGKKLAVHYGLAVFAVGVLSKLILRVFEVTTPWSPFITFVLAPLLAVLAVYVVKRLRSRPSES